MKAQQPAEGILQSGDWGSSKSYQVICGCQQSDHEHTVWVEAEETGVNVTVYVNVKSPLWSMNRLSQIWKLITKGYLEHETTILMNKQQAFNYAETIKTAIRDVEEFEKIRRQKKNPENQVAHKLAEEGDCV